MDKNESVYWHGISLSPHFTLNTQMLTVLTQCISKWKSLQDIEFFTSEEVLLLKFTDEYKPFMVISVLM